MRIAVLDDYHGALGRSPHLERLRPYGEVLVHQEKAASEQETIAYLQGVQVVIPVRERTAFPASLLRALPDLQLIAQTGAGIAHIDVAAATEQGIVVATSAGSSTPSVVELVFGLLIGLLRHIPQNHAALQRGEWPWDAGTSLAGKTLGILGLGRIGQEVARVGRAFGMEIIAWGPTLTPQRAAAHGARFLSLEELLAQADGVSIHLRLSDQSRGLLGREQLRLMKPTAVLVNTARGAIVDEAALVEALQRGAIAGAGLDVFAQEPLPPESPLQRLPNVVLSPHVGWVTYDAYDGFLREVVEVVVRFLEGSPINVVNPEALGKRSRRP